MLGLGIVDRHDWVSQNAILRHRAQPNDAGGGLFRAADDVLDQLPLLRMNDPDGIRAVIHREVRLVLQGTQDMLIIGVVVLALNGKGRDPVMLHQRGGHIVLRGQWVRRAQHHFHAARFEGPHEIRRLGGDMEAGHGGQPFQRLFFLEALADGAQHGHFPLGPFDAALAGISEAEVFHIIGGRSDRQF